MNFFWPLVTVLLLSMWTMSISVESATTVRSRERRFAVISNPNRSFWKLQFSLIIPVVQLVNQTFTFLWFDFQERLPLASAADLNTLYNSFGRSSEKGLDWVNDPFIEEQKANMERRYLYQYIEGIFNGYFIILIPLLNFRNNCKTFNNSFGADGTGCVLRAICDMAEAPLHSNGLLGQAVELVMT